MEWKVPKIPPLRKKKLNNLTRYDEKKIVIYRIEMQTLLGMGQNYLAISLSDNFNQ